MNEQSPGPGGGKSLRARVFDRMQNVIAQLGTSRDKRSFSTYTPTFPIGQLDIETFYSSSWLADKIVSILPDDMTREWVDVSWDGLDDDPQDKKALRDAVEAIDLRSKVNEAARWGRLYGGAVIVIGLTGEDLATPLDMETITKGALKFLLVFDRYRCVPFGLPDPELGPNLDMPVFYREARSGLVFHWSRLVRFDGRKLPWREKVKNDGWDGSVLQPLMDSIRDYDFTRAGIASMVYEANVDIIAIEGLYDMVGTADGEAQLTRRFATAGTMKSVNQMLLLDKDKETFAQKTTAFAGVNEVLQKLMTDVSGAADVPITRLFGQSPGGLNATGDSDAQNYNNHVAAKQQTHLRRPLKVLYEVLARSTLGYLPENFDFSFRPLSQMSSSDRATIQKTNADRDAIYLREGVLTEGAIARQLKDDNVYSTLEEEDVKMAEELALQPELEPGPIPPALAPGMVAPPAKPRSAPPPNGS